MIHTVKRFTEIHEVKFLFLYVINNKCNVRNKIVEFDFWFKSQ